MKKYLQYLISFITIACLLSANIYSAETQTLPSTGPYPYGISSLADDQASTNAICY